MTKIIRVNDENKAGKNPESQSQMKYNEFATRFQQMTDEELIKAFNREVGMHGWGNSRANSLSALHDEFIRRSWEYSIIGDKNNLSFKTHIKLVANKIFFALKSHN
ncbi:MAG: hypothetical protein H8E61_00315 [Bacteroidetes bacterium]|nr:hypothetical protein [Bacteroidota bacterium]